MPPLNASIPAALLIAAIIGAPLRAADVDDLGSLYVGSRHSSTSAANDDVNTNLTITEKSSNGKFKGFLDKVAITGKINSAGAIKFNGKFTSNNGNTKLTKGKAQLSASGGYVLGSFTLKSTGSFSTLTGKYTFITSSLSTAAPANHAAGTGGATVWEGFDISSVTTDPETRPAFLAIENPQSNGAFTGDYGGIPVTGKITSTGKVTFGGVTTVEGGSEQLTAKGQLSFTGTFLLGSFKTVGKGALAGENNSGTFYLSSEER